MEEVLFGRESTGRGIEPGLLEQAHGGLLGQVGLDAEADGGGVRSGTARGVDGPDLDLTDSPTIDWSANDLSIATLDDAGNVGVKIVNEQGRVEFVVADIALSSHDGVWLAGLPETATIITVGQGYVTPGSTVAAVPESAVETAVAIKDNEETD